VAAAADAKSNITKFLVSPLNTKVGSGVIEGVGPVKIITKNVKLCDNFFGSWKSGCG
jgi:hypothetical protein